jgi:hypothetical protein
MQVMRSFALHLLRDKNILVKVSNVSNNKQGFAIPSSIESFTCQRSENISDQCLSLPKGFWISYKEGTLQALRGGVGDRGTFGTEQSLLVAISSAATLQKPEAPLASRASIKPLAPDFNTISSPLKPFWTFNFEPRNGGFKASPWSAVII